VLENRKKTIDRIEEFVNGEIQVVLRNGTFQNLKPPYNNPVCVTTHTTVKKHTYE